MVTQTSNSSFDLGKKIKLVNGDLTKTKAFSIVSSLIDQRKNFNKIELQSLENKYLAGRESICVQINELQTERNNFKQYLKDFKRDA